MKKPPGQEPQPRQAPNKVALALIFGAVMVMFGMGATLLLRQLEREHPAVFWTVISIIIGIFAGVVGWGIVRVVRWARRPKEKA